MSGNDAGDQRGTGRAATTDGDLSARLKRLEMQIDRKRPDQAAADRSRRSGTTSAAPSALGKAFRISAEFMAGVMAGGLLGWTFDHYLGTKPWGMIVLLMLGFATGIYNVMRVSGFTAGSGSGDGRQG